MVKTLCAHVNIPLLVDMAPADIQFSYFDRCEWHPTSFSDIHLSLPSLDLFDRMFR